MKKIRYFLVVAVLLATLSGLALQSIGSMVYSASSQGAVASFAAGHTARPVAFKRFGPCPVQGYDC